MRSGSRNTLVRSMSAFQKFLNHPAGNPHIQKLLSYFKGPKTIHFWAPVAKWALVIAGLGDIQRPVEKVSLPQSTSLAATGLIWARYSLVIIPKNWSLFSVNLFVGFTGLYQLGRIWK